MQNYNLSAGVNPALPCLFVHDRRAGACFCCFLNIDMLFFTAPFCYSNFIFRKFTWSGAGLLFESIIKSADAVKTAIQCNIDHLLICGL